MGDRTVKQPRRVPEADGPEIERLARVARAGDASVTPPVDPTDESREIAHRVVLALDGDCRDPKADEATRNEAYRNLRGLAVDGAATVARRILRASTPFKITRNGAVTTISGAFSVPSHMLVADGVADAEENSPDSGDATPLAARRYVQWDFESWAIIEWLRDHLTARRDGLSATVAVFDEVLKLKPLYPGLSPHEAMLKAGLDPRTLEINLDQAFDEINESATASDLGIQDEQAG